MKNVLNFLILVILGFALIFTACDDHEIPVIQVDYPQLEVVNDLYTYTGTITDVSLPGYEFNNCNIPSSFQSSKQIFALQKGMPDGYEDIKVKVDVQTGRSGGGVLHSLSINVDFKDAQTTTIRVKQSDDGTIYLE